MTAERLRVAYLSPLPPQASGIADYSAELLPALARHFDLDLFAEPGPAAPRPGAELAGEGLRLRPLAEFPPRFAGGRYAAAVYQLGNHPDHHAAIYRTLLAHPGIVVLHEFMLHHLVQGITLGRGDRAGYLEAMRYCYGGTGVAVARRHLETGLPVDVWPYPLFERAVDASLGVIVHNETARRRVLASRPRARVERVPAHLALPAAAAALDEAAGRRRARTDLGLAQERLIVASFGLMTPQKRLGVALRAFARLRRQLPDATYLLVGEVSPFYDLGELLRDGLGEGVRVLGRVGFAEFIRYMQACDLAVNLRHPSGGETSATLLRLLGLGKPVVVSNEGSLAELPDGCVAKVDLDAAEEEVLAALLATLARDPELRRRLGANARRYARAHHALEVTAAGYAELIREVAAAPPEPYRPAPPLAPCPDHDLASALAGRVGAELADLGVEEAADDLLAGIASALVDLDLDLPGAGAGPAVR